MVGERDGRLGRPLVESWRSNGCGCSAARLGRVFDDVCIVFFPFQFFLIFFGIFIG